MMRNLYTITLLWILGFSQALFGVVNPEEVKLKNIKYEDLINKKITQADIQAIFKENPELLSPYLKKLHYRKEYLPMVEDDKIHFVFPEMDTFLGPYVANRENSTPVVYIENIENARENAKREFEKVKKQYDEGIGQEKDKLGAYNPSGFEREITLWHLTNILERYPKDASDKMDEKNRNIDSYLTIIKNAINEFEKMKESSRFTNINATPLINALKELYVKLFIAKNALKRKLLALHGRA